MWSYSVGSEIYISANIWEIVPLTMFSAFQAWKPCRLPTGWVDCLLSNPQENSRLNWIEGCEMSGRLDIQCRLNNYFPLSHVCDYSRAIWSYGQQILELSFVGYNPETIEINTHINREQVWWPRWTGASDRSITMSLVQGCKGIVFSHY